MSYSVMPFAVSLPQLRKVVGSRSKSQLLELREEFEDELQQDREEVEEANEDDEFDPELPLGDALRHLIMDEERWDYEGATYGRAIELMCSFYGEFLHNDHWSGVQLSWVEAVSDALEQAGVSAETFSIFGHLLDRGSPIDIPEIEDFPLIGYVTLAEIPAVLAVLTDDQFAVIKDEGAEGMRISLEQVREWLETCQRDKSDLVCVCY